MKTITRNHYIQCINQVVNYINNHLNETIVVEKLAQTANLSPFHFCRIFKAITDESPIAFVARLRIETAAQLLRYSSLPIETIAFNIGYETPAALSKAFKLQYGFSPTQYRNDKEKYIVKQEIIHPTLTLKVPKIVELAAKKVIYVSQKGAYGMIDYGRAYEQLWGVVKEQKLFTKGIESIGIFHDDPKITDVTLQRADVCLAVHKPAIPVGEVSCRTIAGGLYAVFSYQGSYDQLQAVCDAAMRWVVGSDYELRDEPLFEKYLNDARRTPAEKLKTEIYVPIQSVSR